MNTPTLRVETAAIRLHDGRVFTLPRPARHHDLIKHICEQLGVDRVPPHDQGFVLSDGRWCRRTPAKAIAERAGQLLPRAGGHAELYSEDLW